MKQKTGIAATLSILAAVGSFVLVCAGHPLLALISAIVALPLGLMGLLMAASPRVSGGLISIAGMFLGVAGVVFSILGVVGVVLF